MNGCHLEYVGLILFIYVIIIKLIKNVINIFVLYNRCNNLCNILIVKIRVAFRAKILLIGNRVLVPDMRTNKNYHVGGTHLRK